MALGDQALINARELLMAKLAVDAVRAFDLIVKQSQNSNPTVRVVAQQVIDAYATGGQTANAR